MIKKFIIKSIGYFNSFKCEIILFTNSQCNIYIRRCCSFCVTLLTSQYTDFRFIFIFSSEFSDDNVRIIQTAYHH